MQVSPSPSQAVSQHTPSTQFPLPQLSASVHDPPFSARGLQIPFEQKSELAQSPSTWQRSHDGPLTGAQVPTLPRAVQVSHSPSQAVSQHTPSTQLPLPHSAEVVQAPPFSARALQTPSEQKSPLAQSASPSQPPVIAGAPASSSPASGPNTTRWIGATRTRALDRDARDDASISIESAPIDGPQAVTSVAIDSNPHARNLEFISAPGHRRGEVRAMPAPCARSRPARARHNPLKVLERVAVRAGSCATERVR